MTARLQGGRRPAGSGSAVLVAPDGFAFTSAYVVGEHRGGDATLADGSVLALQVVGSDSLSDLAVVHLDGSRLPPA